MMTDSVEGEMSNGGGSGEQERRVTMRARARARAAELEQAWEAAYDQARVANAHARGYVHALTYAHLRAYVSLAVKASGLVALLLSTVILLGGYVQSLGKKDFFCIIAITVIQAAGIFQDWENNVQYFLDFQETVLVLINNFNYLVSKVSVKGFSFSSVKDILTIYIATPVVLPFLVLVICVQLFYLLGPLACAAISSWRIAKLNHGNHGDGTDSMADMMAALNIFYSLIIFQGSMFLVLLLYMILYRAIVARRLLALERLSDNKWGKDAIDKYLFDITVKCRKDPISIKGTDLIKYGAELLDSESQEDYLYGARLLSAFVNNKGEDVSWVLLPSRHRIQRLIDSLMISSSSSLDDEDCVQLRRYGSKRCFAVIGGLDDKREIRELAATIVADVAAHIDDLSKYPGAIRRISSLLQHQEEATQTYRNRNNKQVPDPPVHPRPIGPLTKREHDQDEDMQKLIEQEEEQGHMKLMRDQKRMVLGEHRHRHHKREGGRNNELVQQGLTILERLASNSDNNRRIICSAPGLLPKITAPLYSATLIKDVKTKAWADIVTRSLTVLYQLIRAPAGWTSRRLRHEISSDDQALSNLKSILDQGNEADHQELRLVAMEILTELALDLSINLTEETKKVLITKQLQLFLFANGDDEEESATIAGRALVSLSTNSESNSTLIMTMEKDIYGHLTGILDDVLITRRTIAAEIMANLCAHCNVDNMKEILPKVLREIMSITGKSQQRKASADQKNPVLGDEENQGKSVSTKTTEERHRISTQGDDIETEEISDQEREEQVAFLSLAQVICDKLNSADLDGASQNAVQNENNAGSEEQRREAFVDKLKTIIDGNCHLAADSSLRIVKLCGQIAKSVMRCEQYAEHFRNKGFKSALSEASKTMSKLESCMLFVGTDFGDKKTVRPLFSEIEESFGQI